MTRQKYTKLNIGEISKFLTGRGLPCKLSLSFTLSPSFNSLNNQGGEITHTLTAGEMPVHNHSGTTNSAGNAIESETVQSGSGAIVSGSGSHVHTFTTANAGSGLPHNNLQPYLVVNYIIKC